MDKVFVYVVHVTYNIPIVYIMHIQLQSPHSLVAIPVVGVLYCTCLSSHRMDALH